MTLLNNTKWVALAQGVKILSQVASLVLLARLIPPNEYGLMAMASVVVALGFLFRDMGTSAALIQKKELTENLKNAVFCLNLITGLFLCLIVALVSPIASSFFNQPELIPVLLLLSLTFPITCLSSSHLALMERESKFKRIAVIESMSSLIATISAIIAAYNSFGVYSLVIQSLLNATLSTILIWNASKWLPAIDGYKNLKEIKAIFSFSGNLVAFNFINYFSRNTDRFVVGRFMSSTVLGAYDLAYKIMLFPLQTLTFVVNRAMLPVLSNFQDNNKNFNDTYLQALTWITLISFPLMAGMAALREPLVNLVFGNQWSLVGQILLWLAPTGMLQSMNSTTGSVLTAKGKTNVLFYTGIMCATIYITCFMIAPKTDIVEFSEYYFYSNILAVTLNLWILFRMIKLNFLQVLKNLLPAIISTSVMYLILVINVDVYEESFLNLFIMIVFSMVIYFCVYMIFPNNIFIKVLNKRKV